MKDRTFWTLYVAGACVILAVCGFMGYCSAMAALDWAGR